MARIFKVKNAYRSLVEDARNFIEVLNGLNLQLEIVQKKLNDLLAAKRAMFPRFYFLSNEDLLEMIGQAKNPVTINKHIKKIYEGINKIKTEQTQAAKGQREHIITMVEAEDGEQLSV
jgi:dynein heavy chain